VDDGPFSCHSDGTPISGGNVGASYSPDSLYVHTGQERPADPFASYAARGAQVLTDGSTNLCNHDIALIVLDTAITNMPISPVRLDSDAKVGELVTAVGWGKTENGTPSERQQRTGISVLDVGPGTSALPNDFILGEAVCSGDSGGPAFSAANAVIGIVSGVTTCEGPNAKDTYTKLSPFKNLILQGYQLAGAQPWYEGTVEVHQLCVDTINSYRTGLPPLTRWKEAESCADSEAATDMANNHAFSSNKNCLGTVGNGTGTSTELPGFAMPIEPSLESGAAYMWNNHWNAMTNPNYTKVACGIATSADGKTYWAEQDFQ
jgi:hypothetical protein